MEKATGCRLVTDLLPLSSFVQMTRFRIKTVDSILSPIRKDEFMASPNLMDTYFQSPFHYEPRMYLHFILEGVLYQSKVACLSLLSDSQVFTHMFELAPL